MSANEKQVGGTHYRAPIQHWDLAVLFGWDYLQGQAIKYLMRAKGKNGRQDVEKAGHFVQKYLEEMDAGLVDMTPPQVHPLAAWLAKLGVPFTPEEVSKAIKDAEQLRKLEWALSVLKEEVYPTGWKFYTFEGAKGNEEAYRCKRCLTHFKVPMNTPPAFHHSCPTGGTVTIESAPSVAEAHADCIAAARCLEGGCARTECKRMKELFNV